MGYLTYTPFLTPLTHFSEHSPRQRRKYLGKKDPKTQNPITPRKMPVISSSMDYGHLYLLRKIAQHIGLVDSIQESFGHEMADALLNLSYFQILEGRPWYLYGPWCEGMQGVTQLASQKISKVLNEVGSDEGSMNNFFSHWAKKQKPLKGVWLDITSISSYSEQNNWLEWGYNRDGESLPQVNLGVLVGGTTQLPFFYQLYPGSIADVSTLDNIGLRAKDFELILRISKKTQLFCIDDYLVLYYSGDARFSNFTASSVVKRNLKYILRLFYVYKLVWEKGYFYLTELLLPFLKNFLQIIKIILFTFKCEMRVFLRKYFK